jgi:Sulfatase-modifying factor enzyme 1
MEPAVLGRTATFSMAYPGSAAGNLYGFLWCSPPYAGTIPVTFPGITVNGLARVLPGISVLAFSGVLGASGSVAHSIAVPNTPALVGYAWGLQSADLDTAHAVLSFGDNALALQVADVIPPNMIPIPAGSFQMGSLNGTANERPVHTVFITRPFWMAQNLVTQTEYQALLGVNPSHFVGANNPVEMVSWNDAMAY